MLKKHAKGWCPEGQKPFGHKRKNSDTEDEEAGSPKKEKLDFLGDEEATFHDIAEKAKKTNESSYQDLVKQLLKEGMSKKKATSMAEQELEEDDKAAFLEKYARILGYLCELQHGPLHNEILATINKLVVEREFPLERAIKTALKKKGYLLEKFLWP